MLSALSDSHESGLRSHYKVMSSTLTTLLHQTPLCIGLGRYLRSLNLILKGKKPSFSMKTGFLSNC
ncbi:hypothetical protein [Nostoc sp.]|uniref:hypothetical protein n=1 Tax=Nostoc sp. TaxID=1180 RepID=UPI002FF5F183